MGGGALPVWALVGQPLSQSRWSAATTNDQALESGTYLSTAPARTNSTFSPVCLTVTVYHKKCTVYIIGKLALFGGWVCGQTAFWRQRGRWRAARLCCCWLLLQGAHETAISGLTKIRRLGRRVPGGQRGKMCGRAKVKTSGNRKEVDEDSNSQVRVTSADIGITLTVARSAERKLSDF